MIFDVYSAYGETHDYASTARHEERCKREREREREREKGKGKGRKPRRHKY